MESCKNSKICQLVLFKCKFKQEVCGGSHGVAVITSALHAEGLRIEPGWDLTIYPLTFFVSIFLLLQIIFFYLNYIIFLCNFIYCFLTNLINYLFKSNFLSKWNKINVKFLIISLFRREIKKQRNVFNKFAKLCGL